MTEVPTDVLPDAEAEWTAKTCELPTESQSPLEWWSVGDVNAGFGGVLNPYGGAGRAFGGSVREPWELIFLPANAGTIEAELRHLARETAPAAPEREREQRVLSGPVLTPQAPPAANATAESAASTQLEERAVVAGDAAANANILTATSTILPPPADTPQPPNGGSGAKGKTVKRKHRTILG